MLTRKRHVEQMAATLVEWAAQIADLQKKGLSAGTEQQARIVGQVAALKQLRAEYEAQMLEMRDTSAAVFRDMQKRAEQMVATFRKSYVQTATRFAC
jgi:cysteine sulfinate desulfinase/cysteine desulfurase-like protein